MEMGFDQEAWPRGQHRAMDGAAPQGAIDWHGLRARFTAAHAYRAAIGVATPRDGQVGKGSFHCGAADSLAAYDGASSAVNPNDLADRKGQGGKWSDIDGGETPGDRGQ